MNTNTIKKLDDTVVLYHASCTDGAAAMWSAWKYFGDKATYVPVGKESKKRSSIMNKCIDASQILMCDMMLEMSDIEYLLSNGKIIHLLDHHISNIEKVEALGLLQKYPDILHDHNNLKRSGGGITWDTLNGGKRPAIIDYVEDFDLWNWALPDGDSINTYLSQFSWKNNEEIIERFNEFETLSAKQMSAGGKPLVEFKDQLISRSLSQVGRAEISVVTPTEYSRMVVTYNVPIINTNHFVSEIGNKMCDGESFAVIWQVTKSGEVRISLRSNEKGENVSKIAQYYGEGGGGHECAAGTRFLNIEEFISTVRFIDGPNG